MSGKGDWRRPAQENDNKIGAAWCDVFGHRWSQDGEWCTNCGAKHADAVGES